MRRTTSRQESAALAMLPAGKPSQFINPPAPTSRLPRPAVPATSAETSAPPAVTSRPGDLLRGATGTAVNISATVIFWSKNGSIGEKLAETQYFLVIHGRTDTCPSLLEQLHDVNHDDDHDDDQEANSAPSAASNSASTANNASSSPNSVGSMSLCTTSSAFAGAGE